MCLGVLTIVREQLSLKVASLEARYCTPATGSRGDFLFALGMLNYSQFTKLPEDFSCPSDMMIADNPSLKSRSRLKSMLSWFSIDSPEHRRLSRSPSRNWTSSVDHESARARPTSPTPSADNMTDGQLFAHMSEPFLHSAIVDDFKFVITLESRDALLEMAESYYKLLLEAAPQLFQMPSSEEMLNLRTAKLNPDGQEKGSRGGDGGGSYESLPDPLTMPGSIMGKKGNGGAKALWSKSRRPSLSDLTMRNLFSLEFERTQLQLLDHESKGCVVVTLDYASMQGRVGTDEKRTTEAEEEGGFVPSSAQERRNLLLQGLAQRSLDEYTESIMLSVQSMMVLVAPTDVDVGVGLVWLPETAFSLGLAKSVEDATVLSSFTTFGLLRPVMNPLPMEADILAIHERRLHHVVRVDLPEIMCVFDAEEFLLFRKVMEHILAAPLPKLEEHASNKQTRRLRAQLSSPIMNRPMDLQEIYVEKRHATWEIRRLKQVLQVIRQPIGEQVLEVDQLQGPSYMLEETFHALRDLLLSRRGLTTSTTATPPVPGGQSLQDAMEIWTQNVEDRLVKMEDEYQKLLDYFQRQVSELKRKRRAKPNTQLEWTIAGLTAQLKQMQRPFLEAALVGLTGSLSAFEDESAELGVEVSGVKVEDLRTSPPTLLIFSSSILRRSPKPPFSPRAMALLRTR